MGNRDEGCGCGVRCPNVDSVKLDIVTSGVTESNKEIVCWSIADKLGGVVTHCSFNGPSETRRTLQSERILYVDVALPNSSPIDAYEEVSSNDFVSALEDLPEEVSLETIETRASDFSENILPYRCVLSHGTL